MTKLSGRRSRPNPHYILNKSTGDVEVRPREKLLTRQSAVQGPHRALERLHERLAIATELYEHHNDGGRVGAFNALIAAIEYFDSRGIPRATLEPLSAIAAAIVDADRGVESPIFRAKRKGGGAPPSSIAQLSFDGMMAVVMECCVRHCRKDGKRPYIEPAGRLAANLIRNSKWRVDPGWVHLREIRERILVAEKSAPDRVTFDTLLSSPVSEMMSLRYARALLKSELVVQFPEPELSGEPANSPEED